MGMEVVITMAGFGRRFLDAGYDVPKYRIVAHGRSLFAWSILSLRKFKDDGARFCFVVRRADHSKEFICDEATALGIESIRIVELDEPTDGQATTATLARGAVDDLRAPLLIYNIDTFVHPDALSPTDMRGQGWIPCFRANGEHWSFAAADTEGRVSSVQEKKRISPYATVGLYAFDSFQRYLDLYDRHYADPENVQKGERFVAPIYNTLIADGGAVYIQDVPASAVFALGTPAEVERFLGETPPAL